MRLVTYNVNSLGARLPRVLALLEEHRPDVVLLQETKSSPDAFPHAELAEAGYLAADQSGGRWAGVAVLGRAELGVDDVTVGLHGEPDPIRPVGSRRPSAASPWSASTSPTASGSTRPSTPASSCSSRR